MRLWCFYLVVLFASFSAGSSDAGLEQSLTDANKRMFALQKGSDKASLQDMFAQLELNLGLVDQLLPILASQPDSSSAIASKAVIFSELCFKYAVELSGKEFPENLPEDLACSYVILFSGTIRLKKEEKFVNYFLVMDSFGKAILTSRSVLYRCMNWVVLLTLPEVSNVPSFLSNPELMPGDAYAHFWSSYIACFCGDGFQYLSLYRNCTGGLPIGTILRLLGVSSETNANTNQPFMDEATLTTFMIAAQSSPVQELLYGCTKYGPDAIRSLGKHIMAYRTEGLLVHLLVKFALTYEIGAIFFTMYQCGFQEAVEGLMEAIGIVTHANGLRLVVDTELQNMKRGPIYNFICMLVSVSIGISSIEPVCKSFLQSLSCPTKSLDDFSDNLAARVGIVLRGIITSAQPHSPINSCTRERWTASLLKMLNLDDLDQMDFQQELNYELLSSPDVMKLFYWLCKIVPGNDHCISKLLVVAVASCCKLSTTSTMSDLRRMFRECESIVLSEACLNARDYGLIGGPEVLDSFVIISRLTRADESSLEEDIRKSVLGYLDLTLFEYNVPNRAFNVASILDRLPAHFDDSQVLSIHQDLVQNLYKIFNAASSNLKSFYLSGNFEAYMRYLNSKRKMSGSTMVTLGLVLDNLEAEFKAPGRR